MKFSHFVMVCSTVLLIIAGFYGGIYLQHILKTTNQLSESQPPPSPKQRYEFRYVGKEKFSNVYVTYRFDRIEGAVDRFTYVHVDAKKDSKYELERPPHEVVGTIRLNDGKQSDVVTEMWRDALISHSEARSLIDYEELNLLNNAKSSD